MKALLWKDCCVNRMLFILGLTLLLGPYAVFFAVNAYCAVRHGGGQWWVEIWQMVAILSLGMSLLTFAGLGGNAFAGERADRSAEFLAYLPPSRAALATSRAVVTVGAALAIWLVNLAVIYGMPLVARACPPGMGYTGDNATKALPVLAAMSVLLFGAAWLASSMLSSPGLSAACGIFAPLLLWCVLGAIFTLAGYGDYGSPEYWYPRLSVPLGIAAFSAGFICYLRRVEP